MANKSMQVIPVAIGLMVSYLSAVSLLGVSSENYVYGTQYAVINISYGLATPFAAYFYLPVFFKLDTASAFEVKNVNTIMQNLRLVLLKIIIIRYKYLNIFKVFLFYISYINLIKFLIIICLKVVGNVNINTILNYMKKMHYI